MVQGEGNHCRVPGQNGVDGTPQIPDALAVNDAHMDNAPILAGRQVIRHQVLYLARLEGVQIQNAVNGHLDWLIHRPPSYTAPLDLSLH